MLRGRWQVGVNKIARRGRSRLTRAILGVFLATLAPVCAGATTAPAFVSAAQSLSPADLAIPSGLRAVGDFGRITVYWYAYPGGSYYEVWRSTAAGGAYYRLTTTASLEYEDAAIACGVAYYYGINVLDSRGVRAASAGPVAGAALCPPIPAVPVKLSPAPGAVLSGPVTLSWAPQAGATFYQAEWSTNGVAWTAAQTAGTSFTPALTNGTYWWRVRSANSSGLSAASSASAFTLISGYALTYTGGLLNPDRLRYQVAFTPYRGPTAAALSIDGLPPGVRWTFNPPTVSGTSSSVLVLDGVSPLAARGPVQFRVMAGTVPVDGGLITLAMSGGLAFTDAHAYPNPARGQTVHLKLGLTVPPQLLKLRVYDLSGAPILEVSEAAPFATFAPLSPVDFEFNWKGVNSAGRAVATGTYIFWVEAKTDDATVTSRGLLTYVRRGP